MATLILTFVIVLAIVGAIAARRHRRGSLDGVAEPSRADSAA